MANQEATGSTPAVEEVLTRRPAPPACLGQMLKGQDDKKVSRAWEVLPAEGAALEEVCLVAAEENAGQQAGLKKATRAERCPSEERERGTPIEGEKASRIVSVRRPGGRNDEQCSICLVRKRRSEILPARPQIYRWHAYIQTICFECAQCKTDSTPWLWQQAVHPELHHAAVFDNVGAASKGSLEGQPPLKRHQVSPGGDVALKENAATYVPIQAFSYDDAQPKHVYVNHVFNEVEECWKRTPMFAGDDAPAKIAFTEAQMGAWREYVTYQRSLYTYKVPHYADFNFRQYTIPLQKTFPAASQARLRRSYFTVQFAKDVCKAISSRNDQEDHHMSN